MVESNTTLPQTGHIEIQNVSRIFTGHEGETVHALDQVSLDIPQGEFVSLIGPSGCGKSTLLRLIAGLDFPNQGTLVLDGRPISEPGADRGLIFQDPNLFPWLNVRRNIEVGLDARKVAKKDRPTTQDYINLVGLTGFETSYPHTLSGGMAQRVAIARALINHPSVLLMDEPLGALDAFTRMAMQDEIIRLWIERRITVVLVTHDIDEAIYMSDRVVIMSPRPGRIQEVLPIKLARPRQRNDEDFVHLRNRILETLHFATRQEPAWSL